MIKKMIIVCCVFLGIMFVSQVLIELKNKDLLIENPYGKKDLHPETIQQLKDENYQNIILPDELKEIINSGQEKVVYFYSSTCIYCKKTTSIVVPMTKELNIDLKLFNLLEFKSGWGEYQITKTPTIVHFKNGKEVKRIEGLQSEDEFQKFFKGIINDSA